MKKNSPRVLVISLVFVVLLSLSAQASAKKNFPAAQGYVSDFAQILTPQDIAALSSFFREIERKTTAEVSMVTVQTVRPFSIEHYAVQLFEEWGIGKRGKDNGVLILLSLNDKQARIEVGYGLEGALPDGLCGEIIRQGMVPFFKEEDYKKGLWVGAIHVGRAIAKEYNVSLELGAKEKSLLINKSENKSPLAASFLYLLLFLVLIGLRSGILPYLFLGSLMGSRRSYWSTGYSGGFSSSSFGGFGGGSSGGGGASGSW